MPTIVVYHGNLRPLPEPSSYDPSVSEEWPYHTMRVASKWNLWEQVTNRQFGLDPCANIGTIPVRKNCTTVGPRFLPTRKVTMVPFNPPYLVVVELVNGRCMQQTWPTFTLAMECLKKYKPGTMEAKICDKFGVVVKFTY